MKRRCRHSLLGIVGLALTLFAVPAGLRAQERMGGGEHDPEMMARHQEMMARHEQTMARMDSLATAMNESAGDARGDAMAALLNEIVEQHRAMHEHMREMMMHRMTGEGHGMKMKMKEALPEKAAPEGETDEHEHPAEPES